MSADKCLKRILKLEEERVPDGKARGWNAEEEKRGVTRIECKRLREESEVGGFMTKKGLCRKENAGRQRKRYLKKREADQRIQGRARRTLSQQLVLGGCGIKLTGNPMKKSATVGKESVRVKKKRGRCWRTELAC